MTDCGEFGFQPLEFQVQFHTAVDLFLRLGTRGSQVALEMSVGINQRGQIALGTLIRIRAGLAPLDLP